MHKVICAPIENLYALSACGAENSEEARTCGIGDSNVEVRKDSINPSITYIITDRIPEDV